MNTSTTTTEATATTNAKPKGKAKVAKQAAPAAPLPVVVPTAKEALLAKVNEAIAAAKGQPTDKAIVILRDALASVHASCPDVELSSNKEQRSAQLKALRESRANLGWQVAARMLGDAIAQCDGVEQKRTYSARQLVNGNLSAVESIRSTLKASKAHRGLSIR